MPRFQKKMQLLKADLDAVADKQTRNWFNNYLQGAICYRGVKTPVVTKVVQEWYISQDIAALSWEDQLHLCCELIRGTYAEDKFCGTICIQRYLLKKIVPSDLLSACEQLFIEGHFHDWSTTDWFAVRVLDPLIVTHGMAVAKRIADWRNSHNLWQRRASLVSFRRPSHDPLYHSLIKTQISCLVKETERFIQTGIGWLLADMSKKYPKEAEAVFRKHLHVMSREIIYRHTKHLACRSELIALSRSSQIRQLPVKKQKR